jgi:uncharacterized membrane protein YsdA (DUF1294 family)/cold shock CspA family protein
MRFDGIIKSWNDERGFGFITPFHGDQEIFVHIKAFSSRSATPQVGQAVTFGVELNSEGKKRAKAVKPFQPGVPLRKRPRTNSAQKGAATYLAIPAFVTLYVVSAVLWQVPFWTAGIYVGASVMAFAVYAVDKSAAVANTWRVSERTLLLIGLSGGWPGAIVAQQLLRHKSSKASFRATFWGTVVLNVVVFIALTSPFGVVLLSLAASN